MVPQKHSVAVAKSIEFYQAQLRDIEARLNATDPQRVVACTVPGYIDPPERIAAAEAERASGVLHAGPMTVEAVKNFEAGRFKVPSMTGLTNHQIHDAKVQAVNFRISLESAEAQQNG